MHGGWIKSYRSLFDHWVWQDNLRFKAWMDLLMRVNHKSKRVRFNKEFINVKKGQTVTSLQKLADSWLCCKDTVSTILKEFEEDGMITVNTTNHRTLITVVKYEDFQGVADTESDADSDADSYTRSYTRSDAESDADSTQTRIYKNNKNDIKNDIKNEKKKTAPRYDPGGYEIEE